jgi:RNA polymerase sigma factor (sigma-70 family)
MNGTDNQDDYVLAQMVRAEFLQEVYSLIEKLPPAPRMVFKMFYVEGLNSTDIAQKLKMTTGAVYNNKSLALKYLRIMLIENKLLPVIVGFSICLAKCLFYL